MTLKAYAVLYEYVLSCLPALQTVDCILIYSGVRMEHLAFFDHLKTPIEVWYVNGTSKAKSGGDYEAALSLEDAVVSARCEFIKVMEACGRSDEFFSSNGIDVLFFPGAQNAAEPASENLISYMKQLVCPPCISHAMRTSLTSPD